LRLPLREIASIKPRKTVVSGIEVEYFLVHTRLAVEIPTSASYIFHKTDLGLPTSEYYLSLSYVDLTQVLEFINQLHGLYRLSSQAKSIALAELIRTREEAIPFESSAIQDIRERVLLPNGQAILAQQVQPLLLCPGRLQLTDSRIYFQNFNTVSSEATSRVDICDVKRMYRRRYGMRDTALEVFLPIKQGYGSSSSASNSNPTSLATTASSTLSQTSVYFNFPTKQLRDTVYSLIHSCERFQPQKDQSLTSMTQAWIAGKTSSFDYLLFLNQCAGRSWMDLTQYPVMPWVLSDYTSSTLDLNDEKVYRDLSKPIGALNPERLQMFRRRMKEMPVEISHGKPFLYGTHYMTPGYVLYYLVRKAPQYMLRLQSGKFDHPDRLFHSIHGTWTSVLQAPTDVKELIPEFYAAVDPTASSGSGSSSTSSPHSHSHGPATASEFLSNTQELDLGIRQNGLPVEDVTLPPWANGSTEEFTRKMREALEGDYVSNHLHEWIDLIFGYKQKDEEAVKADNLFYYLTYEGAIDLDSIEDPQQRRSFELQINEFGQTPKQLFARPHPKRFEPDGVLEEEKLDSLNNSFATATGTSSSQSSTPHKFSIPDSVDQPEFSRLNSSPGLPMSPTSRDTIFATTVTSLNGSGSTNLPMNQLLDCIIQPPLSTTAKDLADLDRRTQALQLAAEVDEIQTRRLNVDEVMYPTPSSASQSSSSAAPRKSSLAGNVRGWAALSSENWIRKETLSLHRDVITSVQLAAENNLVSVSADGHIKIYSLESSKLTRSSKVSDMTLSSCCVSPDGKLVYVASWDNHVFLYNQSFGRIVTSVQAHDDACSTMAVRGDKILTGSWDTTLKVFQTTESSINPRPIGEFAEHEAAITACSMDSRGITAASGAEDGGLILWDLRAKDGQSRQIEVSRAIATLHE
jgi:factor associated with neutral sphingomyelinase activation